MRSPRGARAARARARRSRPRSGSRTPSARSSPTTSGRRGRLAGRDRAGARRAADRRVAAVVERVVRDVALADVVPDLLLRPLGERVELDDRAVVVVDLDLADVGARRPLVAAQAGDPRVERRQVLRQRLTLRTLQQRRRFSTCGRRGSGRGGRPSPARAAPPARAARGSVRVAVAELLDQLVGLGGRRVPGSPNGRSNPASTRRQRDVTYNGRAGFFDEAADVASLYIPEHRRQQQAVLRPDHRGTTGVLQPSDLAERNLRAIRRGHEDLAERLRIQPVVRSVRTLTGKR